jgi:hypothetical protein
MSADRIRIVADLLREDASQINGYEGRGTMDIDVNRKMTAEEVLPRSRMRK